MTKKYPVTPAVRFLRSHNIDFEPLLYDYEEHGGTAQGAAVFGLDEHTVIKTLVLQDDQHHGLLVLMHGDRQVSTRQLARAIGAKHVDMAPAAAAQKWTGYLFGGTSPFGTKVALPIYAESTVLTLPELYINGGKRGFFVRIAGAALAVLQPTAVSVAVD